MNTIREIQALNKRELENAVSTGGSWHNDYRDTAYLYLGGLAFDLSEGDVLTIFSQFGEPVWLKLVRDKETGKSKGFAFLKYEDQRSTDLAVDNLGGATVLGRVLKVDHTRYKKRDDEADEDYNVKFEAVAPPGKERQHRHRHRHSHRHDDSTTAQPKTIAQEHDTEDPMREYLAQEKAARHKHRRHSRERRHEDRRSHRRRRESSP